VVLAVALIITVTFVDSAYSDGNPLNGASSRPFYVFGHNPNTVADAEIALSQGANALEPDITLAPCGSANPLDNLVNWDSSFPNRDGKCGDTKLTAWLDGVHDLAFKYELVLVVFDVKSSAATAENGLAILKAIRDHLNHGSVNVSVIISVATRNDGKVFDSIIGPRASVQLGPREGVQIDEENNVDDILRYFFVDQGYSRNIGYGDGTAGPGPHLFTAIDKAAWSRAAIGYPRSVTYVYNIKLASSMHAFIDAGVDGIISDDIPKLIGVLRRRSDVFLATRRDNPFRPLNESYGLKVRTTPDHCVVFDIGCNFGTDANITFTIEGELGKATITVDTSYNGRMEEG
jgi:hypothetical protein